MLTDDTNIFYGVVFTFLFYQNGQTSDYTSVVGFSKYFNTSGLTLYTQIGWFVNLQKINVNITVNLQPQVEFFKLPAIRQYIELNTTNGMQARVLLYVHLLQIGDYIFFRTQKMSVGVKPCNSTYCYNQTGQDSRNRTHGFKTEPYSLIVGKI